MQGELGPLVLQDSGGRDDKVEDIRGWQVSRNFQHADVEEDSHRAREHAACAEPGSPIVMGGDFINIGLSRLRRHEGGILVGSAHLLEGGESRGAGGSGGPPKTPFGLKHGPQDVCEGWLQNPVPLVLERTHGDVNLAPSAFREGSRGNGGGTGSMLEEAGCEVPLREADGGAGVSWRKSLGRKCSGDYVALEQRDAACLRQRIRTSLRQSREHWYSQIPSPIYSKHCTSKSVRKYLSQAKAEGWLLHAPPVDAIKAVGLLPKEAQRWLSDNEFTRSVQAAVEASPMEQLKVSSCELETAHIEELLERGFVVDWGTMSEPKREPMFVGDVFLHPEPEKKRWRLIFHPKMFNAVVKAWGLQSVELPRLRRILRAIESHLVSGKLDLKCAFFQIPIEPGMFCFRVGSKVYSLTRLPMGSSVSVLVAQALAEMVAGKLRCFVEKNVQLNQSKISYTNVFVDDIFVSVSPDPNWHGDLRAVWQDAMESCANELGVTFKLCQYVCILPNGTYDVPATLVARSEKVCAIEAVSEMEVLGTVFDAIKKEIKMKDSFRCRAREVLET